MGLTIGVLALVVLWGVIALLVYFLFHYVWKRHAATETDNAHGHSSEWPESGGSVPVPVHEDSRPLGTNGPSRRVEAPSPETLLSLQLDGEIAGRDSNRRGR